MRNYAPVCSYRSSRCSFCIRKAHHNWWENMRQKREAWVAQNLVIGWSKKCIQDTAHKAYTLLDVCTCPKFGHSENLFLPPKRLKFTKFDSHSLCKIRLESRLHISQGYHHKRKRSACDVEAVLFQTIHGSISSHGWSKICPTAKSPSVQMFYSDSTLI